MNLVDILAAGIRGCENGSAEIRKRGTSTFAQLFVNYKGEGAYVPTGGITLDQFGGIVVYVNEEVDIEAKDSSGNVVRSLTVMSTASSVEVRSDSFTGTNYTTGVQAVGQPIDLETVLDKWDDSAGADDWKVLFGGAEVTLQAFATQLTGVFYNVKSSTYGATGGGVVDDTSAVQAALTAAGNANGGIVFFPQGTYRITSALTVPAGVSLWGTGMFGSIINIDHATSDALTFASSASYPSEVRGIRIAATTQANTGKHLVVESGTKVTLYNCHIGNGAFTNGNCVSIDGASTYLTAVGTQFQFAGAAARGVNYIGATGRVVLLGCRFILPGTFNGFGVNAGGPWAAVIGCQFDASGVSAGTGTCLQNTGQGAVVGNRFETPTGGTIVPFTSGVAGKFFAGNSITMSAFWSLASWTTVTAAASSHEGTDAQERAVRRGFVNSDAAAVAVDGYNFGSFEVRRTNNSNQTINTNFSPPGPGLFFTLTLNNDQVGVSGTITLGANFKGLAPFTVAANRANHITFRSVENTFAGGGAGAFYWALVGQSGDVTL